MRSNTFRLCLIVWAIWLNAPFVAAQKVAKPHPLATFETRLAPKQIVHLQVEGEAQLEGDYEVDAQGELAFTLGEGAERFIQRWKVAVRDKTVEEARHAVAESLRKYVREPKVILVLVYIPNIVVEFQGAVKEGGRRMVLQDMRLYEALERVAFTPSADLSQIRLERKRKAGEKETTPLVWQADLLAFQGGAVLENPLLEAEDRIFVAALPEIIKPRPLEVVRVYGEVEQEGAIPFAPNMTLRDLLRRVGGLKASAQRDKVRRIRVSDGKYFEADADKAEAGDPLHNQNLSAGDIVIVAQRDQSQIYAVGGAVMQPYSAPWKPNAKITLTRAIELAGGLSPKAEGKTGVLRQGYFRNPISAPFIPFDLQQIRAGKQKNWEISPGDEITLMPKTPGREWWRGLIPFVFQLLPLGR